MRALAVAAILLANAAFAGDHGPRVAAGRPPRTARVLVPAADLPGWKGVRDRDTGVVTRMWGASISVPGAMADPAVAERAARDFMAAHLAVLAPGASIADFVIETDRVDGGLRTVAFRQTWNGLRVVGGHIHVVFSHDHLFVAGSDALPDVHAVTSRMRSATTAKAETWLRRAGATLRAVRSTGERVVLPLVHGPGDIEYRIADVIDATAIGDEWTVYVAPDGEPILRDSRISHASGTLRFDVGVRHPGAARTLQPAQRANAVVDAIATATDDLGGFSWAGNLPATVVPSVSGAFVQVLHEGSGAGATASLTAQPGQPVDWSFAADEQGDAQLTAYIYGNLAKQRARGMTTLAWLDQPLIMHVNVTGSCNASSNGDELSFFRADGECENTARVSDVILHEFGHSLHFQSMIPGVGAFESQLSEGIADFYAANISGDPGVGRGFHYDEVPVRDLDPVGFERRFPDDLSGDSHISGLIIAGALWDLRTALIAELGTTEGIAAVEKIYIGILQRASDIPTSYIAALTADDDDGDLGNGTPHLCTIEAAFARHGLVTGFEGTTVAPPVVSGRDVSVAVTVPAATTCPRPQITSIDLAWQIGDGTPEILPMTDDLGIWKATIPPQRTGTVVRYRVTTHLDDGSQLLLPDNLADPLYQLFVGAATPIWCDRLDQDPKWLETGALSWEWARPFGHAGDPGQTFTGEAFLGTNIRGNGRYPADDTTAIATPVIDTSGYQHVHLQFRRWLTVEDGAHDLATVAINGVPAWTNAISIPATDHIDREWRFVDLEVAPGDVSASWSIAADTSTSRGGWNIDDICLVGLDGPADCVDCQPPEESGCCSAGGDPRGAALGFGVVLLLLRRRRR